MIFDFTSLKMGLNIRWKALAAQTVAVLGWDVYLCAWILFFFCTVCGRKMCFHTWHWHWKAMAESTVISSVYGGMKYFQKITLLKVKNHCTRQVLECTGSFHLLNERTLRNENMSVEYRSTNPVLELQSQLCIPLTTILMFSVLNCSSTSSWIKRAPQSQSVFFPTVGLCSGETPGSEVFFSRPGWQELLRQSKEHMLSLTLSPQPHHGCGSPRLWCKNNISILE